MEQLKTNIANFESNLPQEIADKALTLHFIEQNPDCLLRSNRIAHLTASAWIVNKQRSKVLMVYHKLFNSFAWTGGHADGNADLKAVAIQEAQEETGIEELRSLLDGIYSIEALTVDGHFKNGRYVSSHLHLNVCYLFEADETAPIRIKPDENSAVKWIPLDKLEEAITEEWMYPHIYKKLVDKLSEVEKDHGSSFS